jgi:hybrid polyketide synthase / nonribosomal peptide synthetase ACE1
VLLTGATGFLAKYILAQLAASPDVRTIHCVAVRDKGPELPRKLPISSSKIVVHRGNLAAPLLELSEEEFQTLARDVDVILHMGAVRSFWDNYHVLRPTSVFSTRELVRLAAPRQIPIHYVSAAGVLSRGGEPDSLAASVFAHVPATDGTDGYVATRWASERILERAASELGLPTTVHRFVPSRSPNGGFDLDGFVSFVDKLRIMPDFSGWEGRFDMFPAEQLAKWLCEALLEERPGDNRTPAPKHAPY